MVWGGAPRVGPQHNHAKSTLCGTSAPWAVGRYSTGLKAPGPRTTGYEHGVDDLAKTVPPTCRGVGAIERRPTALGRARPALGHNTTIPSPHCANALPRRSAGTPRRKKRTGRAPPDANAETTNLPRPRRRPVAMLLWSSPGRRRWEELALLVGENSPCVGPQHNHAESALHGVHAPRAVGRYSTGRNARRPHATAFQRGG